MEFYSIQNSYGEVYGIFRLDEDSPLSASHWEAALTEQLSDIIGINGVRNSPLVIEGVRRDRIVVDLDPRKADPLDKSLERVHRTAGIVALEAQFGG